MINSRFQRTINEMKEQGIDQILVANDRSLSYLTGFKATYPKGLKIIP